MVTQLIVIIHLPTTPLRCISRQMELDNVPASIFYLLCFPQVSLPRKPMVLNGLRSIRTRAYVVPFAGEDAGKLDFEFIANEVCHVLAHSTRV